jgi:hypothetical protein
MIGDGDMIYDKDDYNKCYDDKDDDEDESD